MNCFELNKYTFLIINHKVMAAQQSIGGLMLSKAVLNPVFAGWAGDSGGAPGQRQPGAAGAVVRIWAHVCARGVAAAGGGLT